VRYGVTVSEQPTVDPPLMQLKSCSFKLSNITCRVTLKCVGQTDTMHSSVDERIC
jgi:hypothetical protein